MKLMVIGFPKSGTTSITRALGISGLRPAHWRLPNGKYVGHLIYGAVAMGRDPFLHLKGYDAVTQADVCLPREAQPVAEPRLRGSSRHPPRHPACLFLLNYRRPEAICDSIAKWDNMQFRLRVRTSPAFHAASAASASI